MCSPVETKLLISVRNASEATVALEAGVQWIDLKEPRDGSLGQPTLRQASAVGKILALHPRRSVALGELQALDERRALQLAAWFPVLKVGLSGLGGVHPAQPTHWQHRFESLARLLRANAAQLIPVAYADYSHCDAPNIPEVVEVARRIRAPYMLIDTCVKDGRSLLDWVTLDGLKEIATALKTFECGLVLAGSLTLADAPLLLTLAPAALAVRSAVCRTSDPTHFDSDPSMKPTQAAGHALVRTNPLDPAKVIQWRRLLAGAEKLTHGGVVHSEVGQSFA